MATRRTSRISRVIKEVVSRVMMFELADPRMGFITVTEVDVAPDMKSAKVKLSVLGERAVADLCLKAIRQARGHIQSALASELTTKVVPHLEFELDDSVKKSVEISRLINQARSEYRLPDDDTDAETPPGDDTERRLPEDVSDDAGDLDEDDEDEGEDEDDDADTGLDREESDS